MARTTWGERQPQTQKPGEVERALLPIHFAPDLRSTLTSIFFKPGDGRSLGYARRSTPSEALSEKGIKPWRATREYLRNRPGGGRRRCSGRWGGEQPLVRIHHEGIGAFGALQHPLVFPRQHRRYTTVGAVDVVLPFAFSDVLAPPLPIGHR